MIIALMLTFSARWKLIISFSSCFAGGVFIAACLLDLLPDVEEKIDQVSTFFCCCQTSAVSFHWSGEEGERLNSREVLWLMEWQRSGKLGTGYCSDGLFHVHFVQVQTVITSMFLSCALICTVSFPVCFFQCCESALVSVRIRNSIYAQCGSGAGSRVSTTKSFYFTTFNFVTKMENSK